MNTTTVSTYDRARRILVVANETSTASELHDLVSTRIDRRPGSYAAVLVVAPALNPQLRVLYGDDPAREAAELRLCRCVESLRRRGIEAAGIVGDEDPLTAVEETLRVFPADELVISTHTAGRSKWLERSVVARATERFGLPTSHVVAGARSAAPMVLQAA